MVDESFHLTSVDVRRYDFGSALRGYDKARVDQFREQVADELERMARVNLELESKARGFHEQLRAFRERDKALNEALVSAQQLRGDIREQAEREAQLILREARTESERIIDAARASLVQLETEVIELERMRRNHLAQLRALVQRQLVDIDAAEDAAGLPERAPRASRASAARAAESGAAASLAGAAGAAGTAGSDASTKAAHAADAADSAGAPGADSASDDDAEPELDLVDELHDDAPGVSRPRTPTWLDASVPE